MKNKPYLTIAFDDRRIRFRQVVQGVEDDHVHRPLEKKAAFVARLDKH